VGAAEEVAPFLKNFGTRIEIVATLRYVVKWEIRFILLKKALIQGLFFIGTSG
jgi:hypothetical protein